MTLGAKKRKFKVDGIIFETPILIPSFSSRASEDDMKKMINVSKEYITDSILISAFDVCHGFISNRGWTFPELLFLDSGGYEFGIETDLSDHKLRPNNIDTIHWNPEKHKKIISNWRYECPSVFISYDNPNLRPKTPIQIKRAKKLFASIHKGAKEILIKAEEKTNPRNPKDGYIKIESIEPCVEELVHFDIIGFTEKELGRTFTDRLLKVYKLRKLLDAKGIDKPIHIFGSLDPISTPLFFIAGADIFDGLTWLRFGYLPDAAIYKHNYATIKLPHNIPDTNVNLRIHYNNYNSILELGSFMKRFLIEFNYDVFGSNSELFERCIEELKSNIGE